MATQRSKRFAPLGRLGRLGLVAAIVAAVGIVSVGCGALEELDKSAALMDIGKPKPEASADGKGDGNQVKRLDWSNVKSVHSGDLDESIARCTLNGSVSFTRRDDCLAQGGTPAKI